MHSSLLLSLVSQDISRNICSEFHNFIKLAITVKDRVISCTEPQRVSLTVKAWKQTRKKLTLIQTLPEMSVFITFVKRLGTEQTMMLTYDFIPLIASGIDEIFICFKHDPFRIEGDDGHRTVYGIYDCFLLKSRMHALRNIGSNFNDSDNTAAPVRNGDITGFKPYGTISLCQPQVLATKAFSPGKALPELAVFR